jgi:hypothetical protein
MTRNELRQRLKRAADLLTALAGEDLRMEIIPAAAAAAYSGVDAVNIASGRMGVPGGAWREDVGNQGSLREAALCEAAILRTALAALTPSSAPAVATALPVPVHRRSARLR